MPTTMEYLEIIVRKLSGIEGFAYRKMMGEYVVYYKDKVAGGIYDNRFLVKPVPAARKMLPDASFEIPYSGAKEMLRVGDEKSGEFIYELFESMYDELPQPKPKKKKII